MQLTRENQYGIGILGAVLDQAQYKTTGVGKLLDEAYLTTNSSLVSLTDTLDKYMRCELVVSFPYLQMDHMIRGIVKALSAFKSIRPSEKVPDALVAVHENQITFASQLWRRVWVLLRIIWIPRITTSPPDLLEHIAREAHHFYRNLEDLAVFD